MLFVATSGPVMAQGNGGQGDDNRAWQAAVKEQLELAKASDAKVEAEVNRLSKAVADQDARLAATRQAAEAAQAQVAAATRQLAETERRTAVARQALAQHSIDAYVHPSSQSGIVDMVASYP